MGHLANSQVDTARHHHLSNIKNHDFTLHAKGHALTNTSHEHSTAPS